MEAEIEFYKNVLTITGAIFGIIAFFWKFWDFLWANIFSHLQLNLEITNISPSLSKITTEIENTGSAAKKINYAFLLISPEGSQFKDSLEKILKDEKCLRGVNTIPKLLKTIFKDKYNVKLNGLDRNYQLLPLAYFHQEQMQIGNEKIKHAISLSHHDFEANKSYTVRFIMISFHMLNAYLRYRSTSDTFFYSNKT